MEVSINTSDDVIYSLTPSLTGHLAWVHFMLCEICPAMDQVSHVPTDALSLKPRPLLGGLTVTLELRALVFSVSPSCMFAPYNLGCGCRQACAYSFHSALDLDISYAEIMLPNMLIDEPQFPTGLRSVGSLRGLRHSLHQLPACTAWWEVPIQDGIGLCLSPCVMRCRSPMARCCPPTGRMWGRLPCPAVPLQAWKSVAGSSDLLPP